jgi:hypothetical protein
MIIVYTDNAARSYSEEPGVEILYDGKDRLGIAAVLGWLRLRS